MNEKCSLDNLSRYLRVIGLLSLIIILIIVVYYYLQSNHSSILEKYEGYSRRDCVVYLKGDIADTEKCDTTQGTSNYTDTCSYRFDGWSEFSTYTDKDGKTIPYPKKIYTLTNTNSGSFTNPMFTNNCFKPNTSEEDGIPQEFEYNANNVVRYDEQGTSGNTAVGTNIFGGSRYSSIQFLNTPNPTENYNTLLDSICSASTKSLGSLKDSAFYMFEFDGTTNKLKNITSVALNDDQTTFSISSKYNVLTNLPPIITPLKNAYGIQYDTNAKALKIFKKNNIEKEVLVYKFNYMSYVCPQSQIKNYMRARRMITPDKFIKYGSATTPSYSKLISISSDINTSNWSNYSNPNDFNRDYSVEIKGDLSTSKTERKDVIYESYADARRIAESEYKTAERNYNAASSARTNFSTKFNTFSSLIGIQKINSTTKVFDYKSGYNTTSIDSFNISIPTGATATLVGSDVCIQYPYTINTINGQTQYTLNIPTGGVVCDVLIVGGGGGGNMYIGAGGGGGAVLYATGVTIPAGSYTIKVGRGGTRNVNGSQSEAFGAICLGGGSQPNTTWDTPIGGRAGGSGSGGSSGGRAGTYTGGGVGASTKGTMLSSGTLYNGSFGGNGCHLAGFGGRPGGGGGGGGAGTAGRNAVPVDYSTRQAWINAGRPGQGGDGVLINITGTGYYWGAGGGGGIHVEQGGADGGLGGGGGGSTQGSTGGLGGTGGISAGGNGGFGTQAADGGNGGAHTGSGGGGSTFTGSSGSSGGSGIVIIRFKIKASYINNSLVPLTDNTSAVNDKITTTTTLSSNKSNIKANTLSSFIFLQGGTYKFRAGFGAQNNILYSELIIYEGTNIIYSYDDNKAATEIKIAVGKFYKLAFRYIYCNFSNSDIELTFNIRCEKQNLDLTNYLFGGANIKADYSNSTIMNSFSNVKYTENSDTTYNLIKIYLDTINFFNINALNDIQVAKKKYRDYELPAKIEADYSTDTNIKNINSVINTIDRLKGTNPLNNYSSSSELPTGTREIYKNITIDEIFGKNYERLVTKERVSNYSEISDTKTIRPKKIYVEAVAA
jgi:hypothetical protein